MLLEEQDYIMRGVAEGPAAAAPCPATRAKAAIEREMVPDETLLFRYCAVTFNTHRIHYDHPYATGREGYPALVVNGGLPVLLLVELFRQQDEAGREAPPGSLGELWIRGPMVVPGYWGNDAANHADFTCAFWKSGDIGSVDTEGYVRIADRKKDMINRGGFKVYPAEVENVLSEHDDVVEAAVIGRSDDILGERVVAFVRAARAGLAEESIRSFCAARLADYKVPDRVIVGLESLPRNANGKIQKDELRRVVDRSSPHKAVREPRVLHLDEPA